MLILNCRLGCLDHGVEIREEKQTPPTIPVLSVLATQTYDGTGSSSNIADSAGKKSSSTENTSTNLFSS